MEQAGVVGVTSDKKVAKITLLNVPDRPGIASQVFEELAAKDISIRLIIQSASSESRARITFILDEEFADGAVAVLSRWKQEQLASDVVVERDVATIAIVGSRLGSTPRAGRAHVQGAGAGRHQHRLHQLLGDEGGMCHRLEASGACGQGGPRGVLQDAAAFGGRLTDGTDR